MWPYYLNHALILHTLNTMSLLSKQHNKIIVKVGSAVLTDDQGRVKKKILNNHQSLEPQLLIIIQIWMMLLI